MHPIEPLNGVVTFVVTARSKSFTEAADKLGITKSAVGKAIAKLELRLGVTLFHRTTRTLTLSADGEAYFAACSSALDDIAAVESAFTCGTQAPAGRLRVDMPIAFGRSVMLPILLDMAKRYPDLHLTLTFTDDLIDPVAEGIDLSIRFGNPKDSTDLIARRLTRQRWVICASPDYLMRQGVPASLEEVSQHQGIVGYRRGQPLSWRVLRDGASARFAPPATHQLSDGIAMIDAMLAGLGLCQMPLSLVRHHIAAGQLVTVLDEFTQDLIDIYAVWPKVSHLRPKVRKIVDELVELGQLGALD